MTPHSTWLTIADPDTAAPGDTRETLNFGELGEDGSMGKDLLPAEGQVMLPTTHERGGGVTRCGRNKCLIKGGSAPDLIYNIFLLASPDHRI